MKACSLNPGGAEGHWSTIGYGTELEGKFKTLLITYNSMIYSYRKLFISLELIRLSQPLSHLASRISNINQRKNLFTKTNVFIVHVISDPATKVTK